MLTIEDFKSDFQHLIVRNAKIQEVLNHIKEHYKHIEEECLTYINYEKKVLIYSLEYTKQEVRDKMTYNDCIKEVYNAQSIEDICLTVRSAMLQEAEDMKDDFVEQLLVKRLEFYAELLKVK